ncbi:ribosomal RNA small subunit methyltransferase A [Thiosulfatimonas sediminis]|uniref:Ribosomal RNA small subunit methyltransferase A n=1 Tax=Thiosulfatimonas sediminis TaxID=2675054 RepID=A0A6F8PTC1_9GAMM|nr:16S rRNA (adenine(1518)-N(6)/adenine(1519)-N(6))-dimethyltransferase RsmA [Thiosulfatimonas sediminis]BBP45365.1 ribosomal RNA small subunit methyltransferase A [Thiosulfatimonas sediminis]
MARETQHARSAKNRGKNSGHQHKKQFGQNFLNNNQIIDRIVAAIRPQADDHMIEIGPGEAALTDPVIRIVKHLDIIEIDNDLIPQLKIKFASLPAFHLHHTDALRFDYAELLHTSDEQVRVVGNLPYNISSPLMFHLLKYAANITDMHFMLQKEVVERICAQPGGRQFGRLSVMMQYYCKTENLFDVGPENFTPAPKVDSAIVRLLPFKNKPLIADDEALFERFVRQCFTLKRKTLRNNLKGWLNEEQIEACGISASARSETLAVADFVKLCNYYRQHAPE